MQLRNLPLPSRLPLCLLLVFIAVVCVGCGGSSGTSATEPAIGSSEGQATDAMTDPTTDMTGSMEPTDPADASNPAIDIAFEFKDTSGLGATDTPAHVVVPLVQGQLQNADGLKVVDAQGKTVPAQFGVHNRWWAKDQSIRHLLVQMPATVAAYTTPGTGISSYRIVNGDNSLPENAVQTSDGDHIVISNNLIEIEISRSPFSVATPAGKLDAKLTDRFGVVAPTFERDDIQLVIEEQGPIRAVVRASAPTLTRADGTLLHGWAMRLYAYAGQPYIKVDMQLQNAALDSVLSGPLYFDSFELILTGTEPASPASRRAELSEVPLNVAPAGALTSSSAGIGIRQFYETWPNGVRSEANGALVAELFPSWSENQMLENDAIYSEALTANGSGFYWLDDMQSVVKEVILDFSSPSQSEIESLLALVDHPPVAVLPLNHFRETAATLDLGGYISDQLQRSSDDDSARIPNYPLQAGQFWMPSLSDVFFLGWDEFLHSAARKRAPNTAGSYPPLNAQFIVSGNPRDYFLAADRARGELNVMPAWLPGYQYDIDQSRLQLSENPYGSYSWRKFSRGETAHLRFDYLPGTRQDAKPRDDQHGWFYHVAQSYDFTADLWVRDWYQFVGEFRKVRLNQADPFPDMSGRATAHALNHALQAYRITGDVDLLNLLTRYVETEVETLLNADDAWTGEYDTIVASWQTGYLLRTLIAILEELPGGEPLTRHASTGNFIKRSISWNMAIGNFSNWRELSDNTPGMSDGTGFTLIDPQLWYAQQVGSSEAVQQVQEFINGGLNGGTPPYGNFGGWTGSYEGRFTPISIEEFPSSGVGQANSLGDQR